MKRFLVAIVEMLLLFVAAVIGFIRQPFHVEKVLSTSASGIRVMVFDWILAAVIVYVLLLAVELATRKVKSAWMRPTACLFVVVALGFIAKLGLKTV